MRKIPHPLHNIPHNFHPKGTSINTISIPRAPRSIPIPKNTLSQKMIFIPLPMEFSRMRVRLPYGKCHWCPFGTTDSHQSCWSEYRRYCGGFFNWLRYITMKCNILQRAISNPVSYHLLRSRGCFTGDKLSPFHVVRQMWKKEKKQKHFFTLLPMMPSLTIIVDS